MEEQFEKACGDGVIPGVVLLARSRSGRFEYRRAFGKRSMLEENAPLKTDTLLRIASASKLIVSVCAMQCVERGLVQLDDDVTTFVTELENIKLLTGYDENDQPILIEPRNKITFRNLLSHSSGFAYNSLSPLITKWQQQHSATTKLRGPKLIDRYSFPLDAEPGSRWIYSTSIDWVGRAIEHLTSQKLEDFMQDNICKPLGLQKMTFFPQKNPNTLIDHAEIAERNSTGRLEHLEQDFWNTDPEDALGGSAIFASAEDFFAVLESLLLDDQRLLSSKSVQELLAPQLTPEAKASLARVLTENKQYEDWNMGGAHPAGTERDHSLCGMYLVEDVPAEVSPRRPGTCAWAGLPNLYWLIDPAAGLCSFYASQLEPTWDVQSKDLLRLFEKTMYTRMYEAHETATS